MSRSFQLDTHPDRTLDERIADFIEDWPFGQPTIACSSVGAGADRRDTPLTPAHLQQLLNERQRATVAELDGTDDAADWITVGHVLDQREVDYLRSLTLPA